ncbi:hypothetical protein Nther_2960 (plasmid) [Natranaerobius thermophilus JW/NM-WN-LF]|uniref:Uncharacterized protein n=1 Tax=Natranaerobius thermophilus (strain ATCC BAA-1301 / DSM 18059 / JW/NM-WN-LF) TaxID=457570 RepID=B2A8Q6_NATTJ|nr:hypothetical protein Nther_2960 [Natranaerobius thermophilus JW/NM-WN-LF]
MEKLRPRKLQLTTSIVPPIKFAQTASIGGSVNNPKQKEMIKVNEPLYDHFLREPGCRLIC